MELCTAFKHSSKKKKQKTVLPVSILCAATFSVSLSKMQFWGKSMGALWAVFDF